MLRIPISAIGPNVNHPLKSGRGLVLELETGERIFSVNEICCLSCEGVSGEGGRGCGLLGGGAPEKQASIDYWLDWDCSQLKVCVCVCVSSLHSNLVFSVCSPFHRGGWQTNSRPFDLSRST